MLSLRSRQRLIIAGYDTLLYMDAISQVYFNGFEDISPNSTLWYNLTLLSFIPILFLIENPLVCRRVIRKKLGKFFPIYNFF